MFSKTLFVPALLAALALSATAAPIEARADDSVLSTQTNALSASGVRTTWFSDTTGSCDISFDQGDMIVALNAAMMGDLQGPDSQCGRKMRVSYGGKSVEVKVVDTCPSKYCVNGAIDLSQAAFKQLAGDLDVGVIKTTWELI
ncbi:hypothetical protein BGZ73_006611 [Actinomortierella ambigua]|nr:hypothetical protein BGZ73_006611 [Actinomortierella ambigua]